MRAALIKKRKCFVPARPGRDAALSPGGLVGRPPGRSLFTARSGPGGGANGRERVGIPIGAKDAGEEASRVSRGQRGLRATHRTDADGARRGSIRHALPPRGRRRRHRHRTAVYGASLASGWTRAPRAIGLRPGAKGAVCTGKGRLAPARPARISRPCPVRPSVTGDVAASMGRLGVGALGVVVASGITARVGRRRIFSRMPGRTW